MKRMLIVTAALLMPSIATAQPTYDPVPPPVEEPPEQTPLERLGLSVSAGGGVEGFTSDEMRTTTADGGMWGVRVGIGGHSVLGFEGSYIGSAQEIDTLGLDNSAVLVGNGAQGALRLNGQVGMYIQPFIYGGLAWRHYEITNADFNTSDVSDSDDVLEVPLGIGLAYKNRGFLMDVRGELRASSEEDLMSAGNLERDDKADMHRWGVNANLGYEF